MKWRRSLGEAFFSRSFLLRAGLAMAVLMALPAFAGASAETSAKSPSSSAAAAAESAAPGKKAAPAKSAESAAGKTAPGIKKPVKKKSARKSKNKRKSAAPRRQISSSPSQNINAEFQERLESVSAVCGGSSKSAEGRLALFAEALDQWAQWIYGKKAAGRLNLRDRNLLNEILSQIEELPYRKAISDEPSPGRAAALIHASFEHNFRYYYNLPEGSLISPAWARAILKALSCIAPGRAGSPV